MSRAPAKPKPDKPKPACVFPVDILVDRREQAPFSFAGLQADARDGGGPLVVTLRGATLESGDYSLAGFADRIAVERKSIADLFGTIGQGRERFERELARLDRLDFAAVVVEAEWSDVLTNPPRHTQLSPKTVFRSVLAWQQRWRGVHWWFCSNRRHAEVTTFRMLERWLKDETKGRHAPRNERTDSQ